VDASLTTVRKQNKDVKCSALLGLDEADGAGDVLKVVGVHPLDGDVAALGLSDGVVPTYCVCRRVSALPFTTRYRCWWQRQQRLLLT